MSLHAKVEHISYTMGTRALPVYSHSALMLVCIIRQSTCAHGITITYLLMVHNDWLQTKELVFSRVVSIPTF